MTRISEMKLSTSYLLLPSSALMLRTLRLRSNMRRSVHSTTPLPKGYESNKPCRQNQSTDYLPIVLCALLHGGGAATC